MNLPKVSYRGNNIFEVETTEGWWFWKKPFVRQAYWNDDAGFCWVDDDQIIDDVETRIALFEIYFKKECYK